MFGFSRFLTALLTPLTLSFLLTAPLAVHAASARRAAKAPEQETGFLNRKIVLHGVSYRFQVYLPEEWRRDDHKQWPIVLFLHGRGERGAEGMWQTQVGLPQAVRDHPERWPFILVLPQCPLNGFWTDAAMLQMAMATLDQESAEFHADPQRTYLTGLSMGGYGSWELARLYPHRWAAVAIASGGVFWSYAPERWQQAATLPAEYARALGKTPIWLFHGSDDPIVNARQSELMYEAVKANNGHIRLWLYQGLHHDSWTRAYNEPELPRWLLAHHTDSKPGGKTEQTAFAERLIVPLHPAAIKLSAAQMEALEGEYGDAGGRSGTSIFRQGDQLYEKSQQGDVFELAAESANMLFYPSGSSISRIVIERDAQGRVVALLFRDDRHEERWGKMSGNPNR
jgi:poly(3-hydroxybutyrate) depolymerase